MLVECLHQVGKCFLCFLNSCVLENQESHSHSHIIVGWIYSCLTKYKNHNKMLKYNSTYETWNINIKINANQRIKSNKKYCWQPKIKGKITKQQIIAAKVYYFLFENKSKQRKTHETQYLIIVWHNLSLYMKFYDLFWIAEFN